MLISYQVYDIRDKAESPIYSIRKYLILKYKLSSIQKKSFNGRRTLVLHPLVIKNMPVIEIKNGFN